MSVEDIKSIANSEPASSPEIIAVIRRALDRAYKYPVKSVSVAMHMRDGSCFPDESFPDGTQ